MISSDGEAYSDVPGRLCGSDAEDVTLRWLRPWGTSSLGVGTFAVLAVNPTALSSPSNPGAFRALVRAEHGVHEVRDHWARPRASIGGRRRGVGTLRGRLVLEFDAEAPEDRP